MDVIPAGFVDLKQLLSGWSDTETQMHKKVGEPFLIEAILTVRVRFGVGIVGHSSERNFAVTRRNQYFAGIIGEPTPASSSDDACLMIVPCEKHVTWFLNDESGRLTHVFDERLSLATFLTGGDEKMCRISIGEREVSERIEELFAQKSDERQALSAIVFSTALRTAGVFVTSHAFAECFVREAEIAVNTLGTIAIQAGDRNGVRVGELNKKNELCSMLESAGMSKREIGLAVVDNVLSRCVAWVL